MDMKVSKTALLLLVVALAGLFLASNIMYGKANETILIQIVEQQSIESTKLIKMIFEKQKELDGVRNELNALKASVLAAAAPVAVKK